MNKFIIFSVKKKKKKKCVGDCVCSGTFRLYCCELVP